MPLELCCQKRDATNPEGLARPTVRRERLYLEDFGGLFGICERQDRDGNSLLMCRYHHHALCNLLCCECFLQILLVFVC